MFKKTNIALMLLLSLSAMGCGSSAKDACNKLEDPEDVQACLDDIESSDSTSDFGSLYETGDVDGQLTVNEPEDLPAGN